MAESNHDLRKQALKLAAECLRNETTAVERYKEVCQELLKLQPDYPVDHQWIQQTSASSKQTVAKLESDLIHYRNNLAKENLRLTFIQLAQHLFECAQFEDSIKQLLKARDYCATPAQLLQLHIDMMLVTLEDAELFKNIQLYSIKAEQQLLAGYKSADDNLADRAKVKAAVGLSLMETGRYQSAAGYFLEVPQPTGAPSIARQQQHLWGLPSISHSDIAVYGGLCALASWDRWDIRERILQQSTDFKQYLEVEPRIRRILWQFVDCKYSAVLDGLRQMEPELRLDRYLAPHLSSMLGAIRNRMIIQYCSAYSAVSLDRLGQAIGIANSPDATSWQLRSELIDLIATGAISGMRLDAERNVLVARRPDKRRSAMRSIIATGNSSQRMASIIINRCALHEAGFFVSTASAAAAIDEPNDLD